MEKVAFNSLLAKDSIGIKPFGYEKVAGGIESPDQGQLEQDFAKLAYLFIQDRAAPLIKYMLGFEVVQRENDGSKAVGIFGFKIGKDYYYVPAFFLNNQIKGIDLLYSKRTNMFMPLQEDWINFIVNRQTIELGEGKDTTDIQRYFEAPNFNFLAAPPVGSKIASVLDNIEDAYDTWNKMQEYTVAQFEKDAEFQKVVAGFVASWTKQELPFEKTAEDSVLVPFLADHGGPKAVEGLLNALKNIKYANAALTFYPDVKSLYVHQFNSKLAPKEAASKIEVISSENSLAPCCCPSEKAEPVKRRFVRDGFAIDDKRNAEEKTKTYDVDISRSYTCPTEPGLYHVLLNTGDTVEAWVLVGTGPVAKGANVVMTKNDGLVRKAETGAVYTLDPVESKETVADLYKKEGIDPKDIELKGDKYIFINEKGCTTFPVEINSITVVDGKRVRLNCYMSNSVDAHAANYGKDFEHLYTYAEKQNLGERDNTYIHQLELAAYKSDTLKLSSDGDALIIPSNWKAVRIEKGVSDDYNKARAQRDAFSLGNLLDLQDVMAKSAMHTLTVASDDGGVEYSFNVNGSFNTRPMNYKSAYVTLVSKYGLSVEDTEQMMKEASANFKSRRLIKLAQQPSSLVGVSMPNPMDQTPEIDPYTGIPIYANQEQNLTGYLTGVPPKPLPYQYGVNIGGEAEMDTQAMRLAEEAAQAGQKQVFDHASIGGLAKTYDTSAVIDSYIPELMKALDRIGRLIFMFYWKNEDFSERYGSNDMVEMEDLIRGVFKGFGELAIRLRKKAIDASDTHSSSL